VCAGLIVVTAVTNHKQARLYFTILKLIGSPPEDYVQLVSINLVPWEFPVGCCLRTTQVSCMHACRVAISSVDKRSIFFVT
jgi:hypothetical protein